MEKCSVGTILGDDCHKLVYCRRSSLTPFSVLSEENQKLVALRCNLPLDSELVSLCRHHEFMYLKKYPLLQKQCCDLFSLHKKRIRKKLHIVTLDFSEKVRAEIDLTPGKKLCKACFGKVQPRQESSSTSSDAQQVWEPDEKSEEPINEALALLHESPLMVRKRPQERRLSYVQKKVKKVSAKILSTAAKVVHEDIGAIAGPSSAGDTGLQCRDCDRLVQQVKAKFKRATVLQQMIKYGFSRFCRLPGQLRI